MDTKKVMCPVCWHEETWAAIRQNRDPVRDDTPKRNDMSGRLEARCPECLTWHPIKWRRDTREWWWKDSTSGCPECGAAVTVWEECLLRGFPDAYKPGVEYAMLRLRCRTCNHYVRTHLYNGPRWNGSCTKQEISTHANTSACCHWEGAEP